VDTSAAIVTTAAAPELAGIHDRMPVFLEESAWERWLAPEKLDAGEIEDLFRPALRVPMSNSIKNDGEHLLQSDQMASGDA
jgi:putative SOS response-associated peptidase YedK